MFFEARVLLVYAACAFAAFYLFILFYEEPTLRNQFGDGYRQYCRTVSRWFPWKWVFREKRGSDDEPDDSI